MSKGDWKRDYAMQQMANQGMNPYRQAGENLVQAAGFAAPAISKFVKEKAIPGISKFAEEFPGKAISAYKGINPYILNEAGRKAYEEAPHGLTEQEWIDKVRSGDKEFDTGSTEKYLQRKLPFTRKGALERALFPKLGAKKGIDKFLQKTDPMAHLFQLHGEGIKEKLFPQQGQKIRDYMSDPRAAINKKLFPNQGVEFFSSPLGRAVDKVSKTKIPKPKDVLFPNQGAQFWGSPTGRAIDNLRMNIDDKMIQFRGTTLGDYLSRVKAKDIPSDIMGLFPTKEERKANRARRKQARYQKKIDRLKPETLIEADETFDDAEYDMVPSAQFEDLGHIAPPPPKPGSEPGPLQGAISTKPKDLGFTSKEQMNEYFSRAKGFDPNMTWEKFSKLALEGKLEDFINQGQSGPQIQFDLGPM